MSPYAFNTFDIIKYHILILFTHMIPHDTKKSLQRLPIQVLLTGTVFPICIFRFAIRKGLIENDPTPHLQEALKPRKVKHMRSEEHTSELQS